MATDDEEEERTPSFSTTPMVESATAAAANHHHNHGGGAAVAAAAAEPVGATGGDTYSTNHESSAVTHAPSVPSIAKPHGASAAATAVAGPTDSGSVSTYSAASSAGAGDSGLVTGAGATLGAATGATTGAAGAAAVDATTDEALAATRERVEALVGHGAAAASVLAAHGAKVAHEAAHMVQSASGISAEQIELIGLGLGLAAGICCLCCLRCMCRRRSAEDEYDLRYGSRGGRARAARRVLAGMARPGRRGRTVVPTEDYDDDYLYESDEDMY